MARYYQHINLSSNFPVSTLKFCKFAQKLKVGDGKLSLPFPANDTAIHENNRSVDFTPPSNA